MKQNEKKSSKTKITERNLKNTTENLNIIEKSNTRKEKERWPTWFIL